MLTRRAAASVRALLCQNAACAMLLNVAPIIKTVEASSARLASGHQGDRSPMHQAQKAPLAFRTFATAARTPETARNRHQRTLNGLFAHPTSMNIKWNDVQHMLEHFGCAIEEKKHTPYRVRVALGEEAFYLDRPHGKENQKSFADKAEIVALRSFLGRVGLAPHPTISLEEGLNAGSVEHRAEQTSRLSDVRPEPVPEAAVDGDHWLIVVDRHETALYHTLTKGTIPSQLRPYDPVGIRHKLKHKKPQGQYPVYHGDSVPEDPAYYKAIASELREAKQVILAGHGTGKASATSQLVGELRRHHPEVLAKVAARITLPAHHLTENQLLAAVRTIYRNKWLPALTGNGQQGQAADSNGGGGPVISLTVRGHGKHVLLSRAKEEGGGAENGVGGNGTSGQQMHQRM